MCMNKKILRRTNMNLTEKEYKLLFDRSLVTGLSISEILRRAIDFYFEKNKLIFKVDALNGGFNENKR